MTGVAPLEDGYGCSRRGVEHGARELEREERHGVALTQQPRHQREQPICRQRLALRAPCTAACTPLKALLPYKRQPATLELPSTKRKTSKKMSAFKNHKPVNMPH